MAFTRPSGGGVVDTDVRLAGKPSAGTAGHFYHRFQHRRAAFDEVAALSVEGLNKSAIARVKQIAWNTLDRWLERAASSCRRFNDRRITGLEVTELQVDEIRTMVGGKEHSPIWTLFRSTSGLVSGLRPS